MYSEEGIILCLYNIVSFSKMLSKLGLLAGFMYTRCPAIAKGSSHRINIGVRKMPFLPMTIHIVLTYNLLRT